MNWKKKDVSAPSIEAVIERNTGISISDFLNPPTNPFIVSLSDAADVIMRAVVSGVKITIYGDYDADGITATAILFWMLKTLGGENVDVILPKRFSEGYGLSMKGVARIDEGLLITIDNGIAAVDEIAAAKAKGLEVVVLDHHLLREDGKIPKADVIVDPSAIAGSEFSSYCGAGIAYKLACTLLDDQAILDKLSALAAIGTVADVMPLIGDNRNIVIKGLKQLNKGPNLPGLYALLQHLEMYTVTEMDIGFKLGPIINAAGRMHDAGATEVFELLVCEDKKACLEMAANLTSINEERKEVVKQGEAICENLIEEGCLYGSPILVLFTTKDDPVQLHEGVVGVLAGRIAEKYKVPTIVLTEIEGGILKGSGRSYGGIHLKKVLDTATDILARYGGHAGAAGVSVALDRVYDLQDRLFETMETIEKDSSDDPDTLYYDIEVNAHQLPAVMEKLKRFAPFGEGNPRIVFKVNKVRLLPRVGKFYRLMGAEGQHIKLFGQGCDLVGFDMSQKYRELDEPLFVDTLGYISENHFGTTVTLQVEMTDFRTAQSATAKSPLASMLEKKMKERGFH